MYCDSFFGMMVLVENSKLSCVRDVSVVGQYRHLGIRSEKIFSIPTNMRKMVDIIINKGMNASIYSQHPQNCDFAGI